MNLGVMASGGGNMNHMSGQMSSMTSMNTEQVTDQLTYCLLFTVLMSMRKLIDMINVHFYHYPDTGERRQPDPGSAGRTRHVDTRG